MVLGRLRMAVVLAAVATALGWAGVASAQSADEHAAATTIVAELEHDTAHAAVTTQAVTNAKAALERATRLRSAGDETHAKAADGLALEWAQSGRDLAKAADAEATATELRHKAVEAQAQLERTRTLVEEGITRIGRLQAQLADAEKTAKPDRVAIELHEGDPPPRKRNGGHRRPGQDPKKPTPTRAGGAP
jgi:hypothetical protein